MINTEPRPQIQRYDKTHRRRKKSNKTPRKTIYFLHFPRQISSRNLTFLNGSTQPNQLKPKGSFSVVFPKAGLIFLLMLLAGNWEYTQVNKKFPEVTALIRSIGRLVLGELAGAIAARYSCLCDGYMGSLKETNVAYARITFLCPCF